MQGLELKVGLYVGLGFAIAELISSIVPLKWIEYGSGYTLYSIYLRGTISQTLNPKPQTKVCPQSQAQALDAKPAESQLENLNLIRCRGLGLGQNSRV